jgi:hypothetical protein
MSNISRNYESKFLELVEANLQLINDTSIKRKKGLMHFIKLRYKSSKIRTHFENSSEIDTYICCLP